MQRPPRAYSDDEAFHIQKHLDLKLDSSHLSYRPAGQGTVAYLEGWKAFNLANEVFGFNGWSSEILSLTTDFLDTDSTGRVTLGMSCMVRIHLRDGTFHDDIGYGSSENQKSKCAAYEKARKEAVTDAMKRALRIFGNRLGNCAYDKMFLKEVKSRPAGSTNNVMRAANYPGEPKQGNIAMAQVLVPAPFVPTPTMPMQSLPNPVPLHPPAPSHALATHHQEIIFDDSVFDNSMMISEEDFVLEEAAFMGDENAGNAANATFPSAGIYPLPPRPSGRK